jgi:dynein heavy chain, axonemal
MLDTFQETSPQTPIFFVLFPGVDPTPDVEKVGAQYDISSTNGRFINISMGQGQEDKAKKAIFDCAKKGYWIMLQNLHLVIKKKNFIFSKIIKIFITSILVYFFNY